MPQKLPSKLGIQIAAAVQARSDVVQYSKEYEKSYALLLKIASDKPFALERVTANAIRIWLGSNEAILPHLQKIGITTGKILFTGNLKAPGWNSNINGIKEFKFAPQLIWASAESIQQANAILDVYSLI